MEGSCASSMSSCFTCYWCLWTQGFPNCRLLRHFSLWWLLQWSCGVMQLVVLPAEIWEWENCRMLWHLLEWSLRAVCVKNKTNMSEGRIVLSATSLGKEEAALKLLQEELRRWKTDERWVTLAWTALKSEGVFTTLVMFAWYWLEPIKICKLYL